ncbi:MAG TPA: chitobiase/beta-hexosaminidase C-terminal domain-containing protein, partial [Opitutaceae bacterium]|nr:chitobiase/beta-hexosaminidase C-terminal domain-containing protein [Opitutaceae bacterium]
GVVTSHTDYTTGKFTVNSFEPEEYQQLVAEARFQSAIKNTRLGMFTWWALRDFTDTKYKAPEGLNTKGLTTYAGDPKDSYYLLRCFLRSDVRTVRLTSKRYFLRRGSATDGVKAYSNAPSLTLTLNGQVVSTLANGKYAQKDSSYSGNQTVADVFFWPAQFHTGANTISVSDGSGNTDSATVYFYGSGGLPALPVTNPLVTNLSSSNSANPAYYMNMPVQPQWPIYYDFDSTADNSFDDVPAAVQGATWIATHRVTKSGLSTALSFTVTDNATIYVMCTKTGSAPAFLAGFTETNDAGLVWRDNNLNLVPALLFSRQVSANESVTIPAADRDALVMFQRTGSGTPQVTAPVFSPGGGSYSSAQNVTLTSATPGASIRYTTDGSAPSETAGTLYSSPVEVANSTTLNAIAYEAGFSDSPVSTASYAIGTGGGSTTVSFEAESLAYTPSGATASVQTDSNSSGGKWVELAGNSAGDFIDFAVPGVPAGTYQLQMEWKGNNSRGILQLSVDGTNLGPALDQYASGQTYPTTTFGPVTFASAGSHTIRLTVTGKNSKSGSYQLSADKFIFAGQ